MIQMYRIKKSSKETMNKKKVMFYDTTLRDGVQSLWAMKMTYGMIDAVAGEIR
jgi:pyruvate carboxylase